MEMRNVLIPVTNTQPKLTIRAVRADNTLLDLVQVILENMEHPMSFYYVPSINMCDRDPSLLLSSCGITWVQFLGLVSWWKENYNQETITFMITDPKELADFNKEVLK